MFNRIVYVFVGLTIMSGCAGPYFNQGMKYKDSIKYLADADTFRVSNYILYSFVTRSAPFYPVTEQFLSKDSAMEKLMKAFANNAIPHIDLTVSGVNYRDSMKMKRLIKLKNIDEKKIISSVDSGGYHLLPVISFTNEVHFGGYMTSNSIAGSGGFKHYTYFSLILYIIKDCNIIYKSHVWFLSDRYFVNSFVEGYQLPSGISIKQEHWDELVRRTMRGYFKQVGSSKGGVDSN